jgi:hypothetical protein
MEPINKRSLFENHFTCTHAAFRKIDKIAEGTGVTALLARNIGIVAKIALGVFTLIADIALIACKPIKRLVSSPPIISKQTVFVPEKPPGTLNPLLLEPTKPAPFTPSLNSIVEETEAEIQAEIIEDAEPIDPPVVNVEVLKEVKETKANFYGITPLKCSLVLLGVFSSLWAHNTCTTYYHNVIASQKREKLINAIYSYNTSTTGKYPDEEIIEGSYKCLTKCLRCLVGFDQSKHYIMLSDAWRIKWDKFDECVKEREICLEPLWLKTNDMLGPNDDKYKNMLKSHYDQLNDDLKDPWTRSLSEYQAKHH